MYYDFCVVKKFSKTIVFKKFLGDFVCYFRKSFVALQSEKTSEYRGYFRELTNNINNPDNIR